jgi:two-component system chemotaxis response regulator CheB
LSKEKTNMTTKQEQGVLSNIPNAALKVVAIAASTGGLKAISEVLSALPSDFPAAITVVQHLSCEYRSYMAEILSQRTALPVKQAEEGDRLRPGNVYIALSGRHLLVNPNGTLSLSDTPKVNFVRPAADNLFVSLASSFKSKAIAVVLTGKKSDGLLGVVAIKNHGGIVIAQDEATSEHFGMPKSAIDTGKVDFILPLQAIASTLSELVMTQKVVLDQRKYSAFFRRLNTKIFW